MLLRNVVLLPLMLAAPAIASAPQQPVAAKAALSDPALSPDGKEIAFIAGGDIWTVPAEGGIARLLVAHPATESHPVYSPDGQQLAFISMRTGNGDIYVLNLATGTLQRRTYDDARDQLDAWSRDGQWLYFSSTAGDVGGMNDIWRVHASGGQPMQVAADRYAAEYWSSPAPDNKTIAITARGTVSGQWWRHGRSHLDESELWLVHNIDAGTPTYERLGEAGGAKDAWPQFAPDGQSVYYMSDRDGNENLWQKPLKGTAKKLTSFTKGRLLWPSIANNGSAIVFERDFGIWRYDVAKGQAQAVPVTLRGAAADAVPERQTVTQGFQSLALAPDGKKLAFLARGEVFVSASREGGDAVRLTQTPDAETDVAWLPDSRRAVYASSRDNSWRLYQYDVTTRTEKAITTAEGRAFGPRVSPDGKWIAYRRNGKELRLVTPDGLNDHKLADGDFGEPPFTSASDVTWSPDSKWIAYLTTTARGFATVIVVPVDGGTPRPVSFSANSNASDVEWSPDGTFIMYLSAQRTETPQLIRIDLLPRTPRFREDQFRDLFAVPTAPSRDTTVRTPPDTSRRDTTTRRPALAPAAMPAGGNAVVNALPRSGRNPVNIVFEGIRERASILNTQLTVGNIAISPDGKNLLLSATAGGQQQLYLWSLDDLARETPSARPLTTTPAGKGSAQWSADSREVWYTEGGRVTVMTVESRQARPIAVTAELLVDFDQEKHAIFQQAWSYLGMNFFDDKMNGADWSGLARTVEPYVAGSRNPDDLRRVLSLMVGELNASHLGVSGPASGAAPTIPVAKLGVRYDRAMVEGTGANGWRVVEVVLQGPADVAGIKVGDVVTSINGVRVSNALSVDSLLMGKVDRRVAVVVATNGTSRELALRPVTLATEKALLYRQWVEDRRAYVAKISNGRLGYVHMFDMGQGSLDQLHLDLDAENHGREGVVVDVRNNNGGFVNAYAIDVFARRGYMQFQNRGSITTPARITLGQRSLERPTVLVVNQHSLSDAEDFTEGYRALKLGQVVGEPTAGWIIFTSNVNLVDGTTLRIPFSRVSDGNGVGMEMTPRKVDVNVTRPIGESYSGKDSQLDAAVATLLKQLGDTRK
ncbi:MAG: S41 family peptidase [Gemmatimonas sp.]